MKKIKRIIALLMALCALGCLLNGCGLMGDLNELQEALEKKEQENQGYGGDWDNPPTTQDTTPADTQPPTETTEAPTETTEAPTEQATLPTSWESFYQFWDYENSVYVESEVATFQAYTGVPCELSAYDWAFLEEDYSDMVEGYDEYRGVFIYAYDWSSLNAYMEYLESIGFDQYLVEEYTQGTSYYYEHPAYGYYLDVFVVSDSSYVAIEPYMNADPA